eukprot:5768257-Alexandrium_andersonii.AAC.1
MRRCIAHCRLRGKPRSDMRGASASEGEPRQRDDECSFWPICPRHAGSGAPLDLARVAGSPPVPA